MVERNDTVISDIIHNSMSNTTCTADNINIDVIVAITSNASNSESTRVVYDWSETDIGNLQAAYFYGYMATMLIGAKLLLQHWGVFFSLQAILLFNGIGTVIFPLVTVHWGYVGALVSRFALGAVQGPTTSILAASLYDWSLPGKESIKYVSN